MKTQLWEYAKDTYLLTDHTKAQKHKGGSHLYQLDVTPNEAVAFTALFQSHGLDVALSEQEFATNTDKKIYYNAEDGVFVATGYTLGHALLATAVQGQRIQKGAPVPMMETSL